MRERPQGLSDAEVLAAVRTGWEAPVTDLVHLPVGFGAHHWRAESAGTPRLFVTYDGYGSRHTAASLADAYGSAIALAAVGLDFVLAPVPTGDGRPLLDLGAEALSVTPWVEGTAVGDGPIVEEAVAATNIADLARLHDAVPPTELRPWTPAAADLTERLAARLRRSWDAGPYGERARRAVRARRDEILGWATRYRALVAAARERPWVVTHGETHTANQLRTASGLRFVDWESVALAPRERDLSSLVQAGYGAEVAADPAMVELFDTEWRLSEIDEYATWFAGPHGDSADDRIAFGGLLAELDRGPWWARG